MTTSFWSPVRLSIEIAFVSEVWVLLNETKDSHNIVISGQDLVLDSLGKNLNYSKNARRSLIIKILLLRGRITMKKRKIGIVIIFMLTAALTGCGDNSASKVSEKTKSTETSKAKTEVITITDQLGRKVRVSTPVKRIVVLQHHSLDILTELGMQDKVVGVMSDWEGLLGDYMKEVFPGIGKLPTPGTLKDANVEEIAKLNPDLVIVSNQMPEGTIKKLDKLGIPTIVVTLYEADKEQASTINPKLVDADEAYTEGLKWAIDTLGELTGSSERADKLWKMAMDNRKLVETTLKKVPEDKRIKVYIANEQNYTYGTGKYVGIQMERAGAKNVAETLNGYVQVNVEQVAKWNPEVIFVQERYKEVLEQIKNSPQWAGIDAVKNGRLYIAPDYTKPWGNPTPESIALGEVWLAKTLYPDQFKDVNLDNLIQKFYKEFYGIDYKAE
jgi:iron complex transport system substrate-binding protein